MKKAIALLITFAFILGVVGIGLATDVKGTVTKVEGKKITVEVTVEVKDTAGAKVGDEVEIKGGVVKIVKKPAEKKPAAGY